MLTVEQVDGNWEIVGDPDAGAMGPYTNKTDAESDRLGVKRFYRHENDPGFIHGKGVSHGPETL